MKTEAAAWAASFLTRSESTSTAKEGVFPLDSSNSRPHVYPYANPSVYSETAHPHALQEVEIEESSTKYRDQSIKKLSLLETLILDNTAALITAFTVAPTVAIIDKAIVAHAGGVHSIGYSLKTGFKELLMRPIKFMKHPGLLLTAMVYAGTFGTANSVDSIFKKMEKSSVLPKFFASSTVNLGLSLFKDRAFTIWYSGVKPRSVAPLTLGLFASRDALTMAASFTLPPILATAIYDSLNNTSYIHDPKLTHAQAEFWAQIALPCAMQFVTTPVHLAAIDVYARPFVGVGLIAWKERVAFVFKDYAKNVTTRMFRILPAFGLGGNMNRSLRNHLHINAENMKNTAIVLPSNAPSVPIGIL